MYRIKPEVEVLLIILRARVLSEFTHCFERVIIVTGRPAGVGLCSFIGTRDCYLSKGLSFQIMSWLFSRKLNIHNNPLKTTKCALIIGKDASWW
jgi:hypothetical protein